MQNLGEYALTGSLTCANFDGAFIQTELDGALLISLGDYNNNIPMSDVAKLGIAVENTCPETL